MAGPPKKTLAVFPDYIRAPPLWSPHVFDNGVEATRCSMFLTITNLSQKSVIPTHSEVRLRGFDKLRYSVYDTKFSTVRGEVIAIPREVTLRDWTLSFVVIPPLEKKQVLRADIIVYDWYGNPHKAKSVRFTNGFPDALPF
jgi:hypothetical protein